MLNSIKGMFLTLVSTAKGLRQPVTQQYPATGNLFQREDAPTPVQDRFHGLSCSDLGTGKWMSRIAPVAWSAIRHCPTQCMSATMQDNPLHAEGKSTRRKIVESFEINLNRCILCGICVEWCNFDAIVMSHEHEMSTYVRNGDRVDLPVLLEIGQKHQRETDWIPPTKRAKPETRQHRKRELADVDRLFRIFPFP